MTDTHSSLFLLISACIVIMMFYGWVSGKTDISGSVAGGVIAFVIYLEVDWPVLVYFFVFFLLGSIASKWQYQKKLRLGLAQENKGKRTAIHAFCNAGATLIFAQLTLFDIPVAIAHLSIACVFATATSDTLSSEMGNILGSNYVNILTLKSDIRGKDGVVSREGTFSGLLGSLLIASLYYLFTKLWDFGLVVFLVGFVSNLFDSVLGRPFSKKG